ncbi:TraV family lipoprotein [Geoalkalibacter subterraneus]|nr:TraV family lipoprotein [Geoalkalibacter subterraneus]
MGLGNGNYGCEGFPEGVNCMSARDVYNLTDFDGEIQAQLQAQENKKSDQQSQMPVPAQTLHRDEIAQRMLDTNGSIPIRTPAQVIRITVFSWEDKYGALHSGDTIYSEVEQRRWMVGEKAPKRAASLKPLDVRSRQPEGKNNKPADFSQYQSIVPQTQNKGEERQ